MENNDLLYDRVALAERLEDLRKDNHYVLTQLSNLIKNKTGISISHSQLRKYENTDLVEAISFNNLMAIANFYDVSIEYLLGKTNSKSHNYTEQMTAKKFGLSDEAMKQLNLITNNKYSDNNVLKLQLINYIIENNNFLIELTENMLEFYKANDYKLSTDKKKQKEIKIFKYELQDVFAKFIDNSYKDLWENKGIKQTFLFEMTKERKNKKKKEGK